MDKNSKIMVAGYKGLVGGAIKRRLQSLGYDNLVLADTDVVNLTNQQEVDDFMMKEKPEYVFDAAAKVGGIHANNTYPADFIRINLQIQTNLIDAAYRNGAKKFLFLGSSCIYPKLCPQPIKEEYFMTGQLEPTNDAYAVAKISGIMMCQSYHRQYDWNAISLMPTNLYGPGDNFHPENSHVMPALIRRFHEAKEQGLPEVAIWGTGSPMREFLYVDDLADAAVYLMNNYDDPSIINVGTGEDLTIKALAEMVKEVVGYEGKLVFDASKPDGTPKKQLDVTKLFETGWRPKMQLRDGIAQAYKWFVENYKK